MKSNLIVHALIHNIHLRYWLHRLAHLLLHLLGIDTMLFTTLVILPLSLHHLNAQTPH